MDAKQPIIENEPQMVPTKSPNPLYAKLKKICTHKIFLIAAVLIVIAVAYLLSTQSPVPVKNLVEQYTKKSTSFAVVGVSPKNRSDENEANAPITITFSEPVRPNNLRNYFTVSPMIPGSYTQGKNPNEVVFKAKYPYGRGTSVKVIINKGLQSIAGDKLTSDFTYNFFTKIFNDQVVFENNDIYSRWVNMTPSKKLSFNLKVGSDVKGGAITIYKGTFDIIVSSLLYHNQSHTDSNYLTQDYINYPIDTNKMAMVKQIQGLKDHTQFVFDQGEGLYYIEAKSNDKITGSMWIDVNDQGLIVRQDDQKLTVASQNIITGDINTHVKVLLYNLEDKPTLIQTAEIGSYGEIPIAYPQKVDLVVGQTDSGVILVPLTVPETQADIRVNNDLSTLDRIYLQTDKPTYETKDTVKFSGIIRYDNDAKYQLPSTGQNVRVWIPDPNIGNKNLIEQTVTVGENGVFSGQLTLPNGLTIPQDSLSLTLYAKAVNPTALYLTSRSYTTFDVSRENEYGKLSVSFDKPNYTKDQTITVHFAGVDKNDKPLANTDITYSLFGKNYYDDDPASQANFGSEWGGPIGSDLHVTLDAQGQADVKISQKDITASEAFTVEGTAYADRSGHSIYGAKTVLVRQGNIILTYGTSRYNYHSGETTINRIYAHDLNGNPVSNLDLTSQLLINTYDKAGKYNQTTSAKGNARTDNNGFAIIQQPVSSDNATVTLRVITQDTVGNTILAEKEMNILANNTNANDLYYHDLRLSNLDVIPDKLNYNLGDTATLTINSPFEQNVLVTYESGRIYHNEWLLLHKGENTYKITLTNELAPSFNVVFSYFRNEALVIEGMPLTVNDNTKNMSVSVTTDKSMYTSHDSAELTIITKDRTGQPVRANVLLNVLDDGIFGLRDALPGGNVSAYFYSPRTIMTNFSASTLGIGTGGGCGGGGGTDIKYVPNRIGMNYYWNPSLTTDQNGELKVTVPLNGATGNLRTLVTAVSDTTAVGQSQSHIIIQ